MKGFGVLLALASAAILLICGPPALAAGDTQNYDLQIAQLSTGPVTVAESPDIAPAPLPVVADPGSCGGQLEVVAVDQQSKLACRSLRRLGNGVQRLLNFLPRC